MVASFVWTAEEAKYLKAVFRWQDAPSSDDDINTNKPRQPRRRPPALPENAQPAYHRKPPHQQPENEEPPAGEFRVLVLGTKGTGKSFILTRLSQNTFLHQPPASHPPTTQGESHSGSCRHPISLPTDNGQKRRKYTIDALEFPSNHLSSNPLLEQALAITESAIVIYDVTNPDSFRLAKGVVEFIKDSLNPLAPSPITNNNRRVYPVILIANKLDDTERQVTEQEGRQAAEQLGGVRFMEVSAKTGRGVQEVFEAVGGEILRARNTPSAARQREMVEGHERAMGRGVEAARQGGAEGGEGRTGRGGLLRRMFWRQGKQQQQQPRQQIV